MAYWREISTVWSMYESFLSSEKVVGLTGLPSESAFVSTVEFLSTTLYGCSYRLSSIRFKRLVLESSVSDLGKIRVLLRKVIADGSASPYFNSFVLRGSLSAEKVIDE
ncbi:MAG: hypothetical protein ACKOW9_00565 [Candidatus Paceibacterota bacterium]